MMGFEHFLSSSEQEDESLDVSQIYKNYYQINHFLQ